MILSRDVLARLLVVAQRRNRGKAGTRKKSSEWTDLELHFLGVKGEYVMSQTFGVPFDESGYGQGGDNGVDLVIPAEFLASGPAAIKTRHTRDAYLLIERWSDVAKVTFLHLVVGTCIRRARCCCHDLPAQGAQDWRYAGWISVEQFKGECHESDWGLGKRWFCYQKQLQTQLRPDLKAPFDTLDDDDLFEWWMRNH